MYNCAVCGSRAVASHKYCSQCGSSLSRQANDLEYRFVTILCTDLSGYSIIAETLDQEELRMFMVEILSEITRVVKSHEGMVEKYIGDAVVAIFGNSRASEEDPARGIRAAMEIHEIIERMRIPLSVKDKMSLSMHTGINTGNIIFDAGMRCPATHGTLGKTINVASRLCDMADKGEILIGESLVSEAMRYFHLEWMGRKILKGFRKPIHVYKVIKERSVPLALHRVGGLTSPLIGRDHELSILLAKAEELHSGRGCIISLIGDAGVGKSRLIQEFRSSLDEGVAFISGACYEHTGTNPYFAVSSLLQSLFGGKERPSVNMAGIMKTYGLSEEHAPYISLYMDRSSGIGVASPDVLREKASDAVLVLLTAVASRQHTIFCIEDIHWADQSTLDLVNYLVHKWDRSCPCMFILSCRNGADFNVPGTRLLLRELSEQEVGIMIGHMFHAANVSQETITSFFDATGGNPFFIEEMANYLLEKGHDLSCRGRSVMPEGLPSTLHGLISSRLDRLNPGSKRLLQEAALIGRIFSATLLFSVCSDKACMEEKINESIRQGFILCINEGKYIFKHDITRDVAGHTLLKKHRIMLHKKIAQALQERYDPELSDSSGDIAYHYGEAKEFAKAVHFHMEAARACQATGAWVEAGMHFSYAERYLREYQDIPESQEQLLEAREGIWRCCRVFNPAQAIAALEDLSSYYRSRGLHEEEAFCSIRLINLYSQRGLFEKARMCYTDALKIAPANPLMKAAAETAYAYTYTFLGRPLDALRLLEDAGAALEKADPFLNTFHALASLAACVWKGDIKGSSFWYSKVKLNRGAYLDIDLMADIWLAHIRCLQGRFDEAIRVFDETSSREKKLGKLAGGLSYLRIQGSIYFRSRYLGDLKGARSDLESFGTIGDDIHNADTLKDLYSAWIALGKGNPGQAKDLIHAALPGLREGFANRVPYALNALAETHHLLGEFGSAQAVSQECIAWNEQRGNADQLVWALRNFADASISQGDLDSARRYLARAYPLARSAGMKPHQAWIIASFGRFFRVQGRPAKAEACFNKSLSLWEEMGNAAQARLMEKELKRYRKT